MPNLKTIEKLLERMEQHGVSLLDVCSVRNLLEQKSLPDDNKSIKFKDSEDLEEPST